MAEDADLLTELLDDSRPLTRGCTVCEWLETREDADDWDRAFSNPNVTRAAIVRAMRKRGYQYKIKAVTAHSNEKASWMTSSGSSWRTRPSRTSATPASRSWNGSPPSCTTKAETSASSTAGSSSRPRTANAIARLLSTSARSTFV